MTDQSKKISQVPTASNVAVTDRILVLRDPAGSPSVRTVTVSTLASNLVFTNTVPATASSNGVAGTIARDSNYLYVCVATNTWKRTALSSW